MRKKKTYSKAGQEISLDQAGSCPFAQTWPEGCRPYSWLRLRPVGGGKDARTVSKVSSYRATRVARAGARDREHAVKVRGGRQKRMPTSSLAPLFRAPEVAFELAHRPQDKRWGACGCGYTDKLKLVSREVLVLVKRLERILESFALGWSSESEKS